jgi:hypothetical protein
LTLTALVSGDELRSHLPAASHGTGGLPVPFGLCRQRLSKAQFGRLGESFRIDEKAQLIVRRRLCSARCAGRFYLFDCKPVETFT